MSEYSVWEMKQFSVEVCDDDIYVDIQQDFEDNSPVGGVVRINRLQVSLLIELLELAVEI